MADYTYDVKSFTATEALAVNRRVKLSSGSGTAVEYADATDGDVWIGVTLNAVAITETVAVALKGNCTIPCTAADSMSAGATLYPADDGKVTDTAGTVAIGVALAAASGSGGIIPCWFNRQSVTVTKTKSIPVIDCKVWDAAGSILPVAVATNDDLAIVTNTSANTVLLETKDYGGTTNGVQYAMTQIPVPSDYVAGQAIKLRVKGGAVAIADTSLTVDAEVCLLNSTSDICATTAQSINSTTAATKDFTITPTTVSPGDMLSVRLAIAVNDSGDASANIQGYVSQIQLLAACTQS